MKDAAGKPLGKTLWDAGINGAGSVPYEWLTPVSHKAEHKVSFVQKAGDDVCLVGAYSQ